MGNNRRRIPAIRRYRRAALAELALNVLLAVLLVVILARRLGGERPVELSPLFTERPPPVHISTPPPFPLPEQP